MVWIFLGIFKTMAFTGMVIERFVRNLRGNFYSSDLERSW